MTFVFIKRILFTLLISILFQFNAFSKDLNDAPAEALFQNASLQFHTQGDLDWAVRDFDSLIQNHVDYPRRIEAILMLAELKLIKNETDAAIQLAQSVLTTSKKSSEKLKARLILGNAFWVTGKTTELAALGKELLQSKNSNQDGKIHGHLFLAEAHLKRNNLIESSRSNDRAVRILKSQLSTPKTKQLLALAESVKMRVHLEQCQRKWQLRPKNERAHRAHFQEASQCLMESLISFKSILDWDRNGVYREALKAIQKGYSEWMVWFRNPLPETNRLQSKELHEWFKSDVKKHLDEASTLIEHWKLSSLPLQKQTWEEIATQLQHYQKEI